MVESRTIRRFALVGLLAWLAVPVASAENRDAKSVELARSVLEAMGGEEAWKRTRYVSWNFVFGDRMHHWDRWTGDLRIEAEIDGVRTVWLMNVSTRDGAVYRDGVAVPAGEELDGQLQRGYEMWVNDSYWMFMPYKLLDPGVSLEYVGERALEDGRPADVIKMTFGDGVGVTPRNRYDVFVARDTGLVEQWSFYSDREDAEPRFTLPWGDWKRFGEILLATSHGQGRDWKIAVHDDLPRRLFEDPAPLN